MIGRFHYGVIYYNYQNHLVFCFLKLISAIAIQATYHGKDKGNELW